MAQLRDALDEGERQSRVLEKDKADLRKALDDKETRLERLQKSSKSMAEELRSLQATNKMRQGSSIQSLRGYEMNMEPMPARMLFNYPDGLQI